MLDVIRAAREVVESQSEPVGQSIMQCGCCYNLFGPAGEKIDNAHKDWCWVGKLSAALAEFDHPTKPGTPMASAVYRAGRITEEDYDEAIEALKLARSQAGDRLAGRGVVHCAVCEDGDHTAESCHHNPMVLARRWAAANRFTNCYHCGYIAYTDEEARAHFGAHDEEVAKCLQAEAVKKMRAECARLVFEFYTREIGELMHQGEHWAKPDIETPGAVHHRLQAAQTYFQVVCHFDPDRMKNGWPEPFAEIERRLKRPSPNQPGKYPPTQELHAYWNCRDVVKRLDALRADGHDRG